MKFLFATVSLFLSATVFTMTEVELSQGDYNILLSQSFQSPPQRYTANAEELDEVLSLNLFSQTSNPVASPLEASQDPYALENFILLSQQSVGWDIEHSSDSATGITEEVFSEDLATAIDNPEQKKKKRKTAPVTDATRKSARTSKPKKFFE
ncbi:MAG: hypothetical protein ACK4V2_05130 [Pseudomonadota bacterium]|jgi:hypothetical protein|nr:hypothetical protein [Alphaproteobacteria bacterium]